MKNKLTKNFLEKLKKIYSLEELKIIEKGFNTTKRPTTFRINTLISNSQEIEKILKETGLKIKKIPYLTNGYILLNGKEKDLWDLEIFKQGKIYLQGITSQIPVELIEIPENKENFKVLDLTAAPGGKTSQISAKIGNSGEIIANELNKIRFDKLAFTIKRQKATNVKIIRQDANNLKNIFEKESFDVIIADLPCSAEGRINLSKQKSYAYLEKEGLYKKNYKIQKEILQNNIDLLKPNGQLIYSTCTLDPLENEAIVHFLISNFKNLEIKDLKNFFNQEELNKISKPGIKKYANLIFNSKINFSYRILPSELTEGFFVAKFIKK